MTITPNKTPKSLMVFFLIGIGCAIATVFVALYANEPLLKILPAILAEGALIFLSALIIERSLLREFNDDAEERAILLAKKVDSTINDFFRKEFDILKYGQEYSVSIYPPRRSSSRNPNKSYSVIAEAIKRSRTVRLFCTSGIDMFPSPNTPSVVTEELRIKAHQSDNPFTITVLSSEPASNYANVRGILENKINPNYISDEVRSSYRSLLQIASGARNDCFKFDWYTYDFIPQAWFLLTETEGFIETYHFGLGRRAPNDPFSCIGGRVPIMQFYSGSGLWQALDEYYKFLIEPNSDVSMEQVRQEFFKIKPFNPNSPMG